MNIFAFDPNPHTSALWLDDKRKNKMITETAQLFTAALDIKGFCQKIDFPEECRVEYPASVINHPCCKWLHKNPTLANWVWLYRYMCTLCDQWKWRGNLTTAHSSSRILPAVSKYLNPSLFGEFWGINFVNCAANQSLGISYRHVQDTHAAYRLYMRDRWATDKRKPTWDKGEKPWWI